MTPILQTADYLLRCMRREPISFGYALVFPLVMVFAMLYWRRETATDLTTAIPIITSMCAYSVYTSCYYGVGLSFVSWRESGFFLTYCKSHGPLWRLFGAQLVLRAVMCGLFGLCFALAGFGWFRTVDLSFAWQLAASSVLGSLVLGAASAVLLAVRISVRELSTLIGLSIFLFFVLAAMRDGSGNTVLWVRLINWLNPLDWANNWLQLPLGTARLSVTDWIGSTTCLLAMGGYGMLRIQRQPVTSRL
jgi:hypothetical protein